MINRGSQRINNILAWVFVIIILFPLVWLLFTSFRPTDQLFSKNIQFSALTFMQFIRVFSKYDLFGYILNSVILSLSVVFLNIIIGTPAAYAVSRFRIPFRGPLMSLLLIVRMVPIVSVSVPLFIFVSKVGLLNTISGLVIAHTAFKLPMTIWLIMIFFQQVPKELEESARIDGASNIRVLMRIAVPVVAPGMGAAGIIAFILTWNDLLVALILTNSPASQPVTVGLSQFLLQYGIDWGPLSAAGVVVLIPVIVFALFAGESLVRGLTSGAVKG
jgi:multiple sugar transport system permease protein